jgi:hypothetical protein
MTTDPTPAAGGAHDVSDAGGGTDGITAALTDDDALRQSLARAPPATRCCTSNAPAPDPAPGRPSAPPSATP